MTGNKQIYPVHSFDDSGTCLDQRLNTILTATSSNVEIQFRSFRFTTDGNLDDSERIYKFNTFQWGLEFWAERVSHTA